MPLYRPIEWTQTEEIVSRSVMFAIGVVMDDAKIEKIANAINAGIKAAL
jgi:8-amino-3,8-dideoxy-alpha-D-manno-octulosonate transaminase